MSLSQPSATDRSPLGVLGFSAHEERLYRLVLRHSGATLVALAGLSGWSVDELRKQVTRFAGAGVVELRADTVVARPPEEALARLINEEVRRVQSRRDQLDAVRGLLPSLSADHFASSAPKGEPVTVEVLHGGDIVQLLRSISAASSGDLLWLRPDPWNVPQGREVDDWVIDLLRAGRRSRAIYPVEALRKSPEVIRKRAEAGEQVRVLAEVPTRLAVLGSSAALIAQKLGVLDDRRLVLRHQSLVAALTLMFEGLWEKAMAVPGLQHPALEDDNSGRRLLLGQLMGGAKDEQIARALGLSVRTVRRRVADILDELGAGSRFQAGAEAVRRGWV